MNPYEKPVNAEVVIEIHKDSVEELVGYLKKEGYFTK
jgi:adenylylsulfate kinase-like enzyme